MGSTDSLNPVRIEMTGGAKFCGTRMIRPEGVMDTGSLNYTQRMDGIFLRKPMERIAVWGEALNDQVFNQHQLANDLEAWMQNNGDRFDYPRVQHNSIEFMGPPIFFGDFILNNIKYNVLVNKFIYAHALYNTYVLAISASIFQDRNFRSIENWYNVVLATMPGPNVREVEFWASSPVFPSVCVGSFKTCLIFSFPNYHVSPDLRPPWPVFWWEGDGELYPFDAQDAGVQLPWQHVPTMFLAMNIKNSPAQHIIWGCARSGNIRATVALTDQNLDTVAHVQQLLTHSIVQDATNYILGIISPDGSTFNTAMAEYNGVLFLWSKTSCTIVEQILFIPDPAGGVPAAPQYAPKYFLAPFKGGCLSQTALCRSWNDVYVGEPTGRIYTISRVMESGSYKLSDVIEPLSLRYDLDFTFPSGGQGLQLEVGVPGKSLQMDFDEENEVLFCSFEWLQRNAGVADNIPANIANYQATTRAFAFNRNVMEGSTGWAEYQTFTYPASCWATPNGFYLSTSNVVRPVDPRPVNFLFKYGAPLPRTNFPPEGPHAVFYKTGIRSWQGTLATPFFISSYGNSKYILRAVSFHINRLDGNRLRLNVSCITEDDQRRHIGEYDVPAPFVFDLGRLGEDRLSNFNNISSFMVGMKGSFLRIESFTEQLYQGGQPLPTANHCIAEIVLWGKEVGSTLYEKTLI